MTAHAGENGSLRHVVSAVDLFAGPGGWSEGLRMIGLNDLGIEIDPMACATREAAGHDTFQADVSMLNPWEFRGLRGLIASPPCTAFSLAGKGDGRAQVAALSAAIREGDWWALREHDPTVWLPLEVGRWAEALTPDWIACEQVPAALELWAHYADWLTAKGYRTWHGVLDAADFGVPQNRLRAFLLARKDDLAQPPTPTHCEGGGMTLFGDLRPWVSMAEAVGWPESWALSQQRGAGMVERHGERPRRRASEPAFTVTGGADGSSVGRWLLHTGTNTMKHSRKVEDMVPYMREIERPAPTVDCKAAGAWRCVNGELVRRVTLDEVAAFQSFPADYPWQGNKSQRATQIGNAVPPMLAAHVVGALTGRTLREEAAA